MLRNRLDFTKGTTFDPKIEFPTPWEPDSDICVDIHLNIKIDYICIVYIPTNKDIKQSKIQQL